MNKHGAIKEEDKINFLIQSYTSLLHYHSDQITRMWTRSYILLIVELALFTVFINSPSAIGSSIFLFPLLGILLSIIWYCLTAQDRYLFFAYRELAYKAEDIIIEKIEMKEEEYVSFKFKYVIKNKLVKMTILNWFHLFFITPSRISVILPIIASALWTITLLHVLLNKSYGEYGSLILVGSGFIFLGILIIALFSSEQRVQDSSKYTKFSVIGYIISIVGFKILTCAIYYEYILQ